MKRDIEKMKEQAKEADEWNRVIFGSLWRIYILCTIAEVVLAIFFQPTEACTRAMYIKHFVINPIIGPLLVVLCYKTILIFSRGQMSENSLAYVSLAAINCFALITVAIHTSISFMPVALVIPIAVASVYRRKKFIYMQVAMSILMYVVCRVYFIPNSIYLPRETVLVDLVVFISLVASFAVMEEQIRQATIALDIQGWKDSLTQMYNHEAFYEELERYMDEYESKGKGFSILIADIDDFKRVNDTYGHAFGDEVIRKVAEIFKENKGVEDLAARYGGEEFALIMPGRNVKEAAILADKIRKNFEQQKMMTKDGEVHYTISIGIAEYQGGYGTSSAFFDKADEALYHAKSTGKNRVCCAKQDNE